MATCRAPKGQGRKGCALAVVVGFVALIGAPSSAVLAEEFLIPSVIAPTDPPPPNLNVIPSKAPSPTPKIAPLIRAGDEIVTLTIEARERYDRLADELVVVGMPGYLEPHKFAVRCLVAAAPESGIDAATVQTWTEVWHAADRLTFISSSRTDREPQLRKQLGYEAQTKDTWPHDNTAQKCMDLAPKAKVGLQDIAQIYAKDVDAARSP